MRIVDLLSKDSILLNASPKNKAEAIDLLVDLQVKGGKITDRETYKQGILAREENGSTAVGEGIAIPHAKNAAVKAPSLAAMTVPDGVDYEALDDEPSNLLFMIAAPSDGGDVHLEVLSRLMVILMDEDFRAKLKARKHSCRSLTRWNGKNIRMNRRKPRKLHRKPMAESRYWQSLLVRPGSPILTWQRKPSKRQARSWAFRLK